MRRLLFKSMLIVALFAIVAVVAFENEYKGTETQLLNPPAELTASEYKLLLNPEYFEVIDRGMYAYWEVIQKAAASADVVVIEKKNGIAKKKYREVRILDTPNYDLRKQGYLIRERRKMNSDLTPKTGYEYAVKYRGKNFEEAKTKDVSLSDEFRDENDDKEIESDVVFFSIETGNPLVTYSVQNKTVLDSIPELKLGSFISLFPVIGTFGLDAETPLVEVGDQKTFEIKVGLGELDFGEGLVCEMDLVVREMTKDGERFIIPEFSYDFEYVSGVEMPEKAMKSNIAFMDILRESAPEWVIPGKLKSRYLYND